MTLNEALAELGIDRDAGSDGARRAYLRLLKTRKPETDPEGFMRLREAYELVKAQLSFLEAVRARAAEVEVAPAEVEVAPAEVEVAPAEVEVGDVDLMKSLLARSAYKKAAKQALLILAAATNGFGAPDPPVLPSLRLMLGLHGSEAPDKARQVSAAFKAWLAVSGQESTQIRGHAAVLWTLVRELDGMKKGLPDEVRGAIARAALEGDLIEARDELTRFRRKQPGMAESAGGLLRRRAPTIGAALADVLDPAEATPRQSSRRREGHSEGSNKSYWFIPMVLIGLIRMISALGSSSHSYSPPPPRYAAPQWSYPQLTFDAGASPVEAWEWQQNTIPRPAASADVAVDAGARDAGRTGKTTK